MRPALLFPLFASVTGLDGIGPRLGSAIGKLCGGRLIDLLWHWPVNLIDRRYAPKIAEAPIGRIATVTAEIVRHDPPFRPTSPYRVTIRDETGFLTLVFFNARKDYLEKLLPVGQVRIVSGRVDEHEAGKQIVHPDHVVPESARAEIPPVEPVYPMTAGLTPKPLLKAMGQALAKLPAVPEWLDPELVARRNWPDWRAAIAGVHAPARFEDLLPNAGARMRLAYDELLASQLALQIVRGQQRALRGRPMSGTPELRAKALAALPFSLTGAQRRALAEIDADMGAPERMTRILQGDVGSGKTVVAFLAMLNAVAAGAQAALMAPTEILARQHFKTLAPWAEKLGVRAEILTGRDGGKARAALLADLAAGRIAILVGTHALISEDVGYADLGLVVVDEQHRFGVHQRLALSAKGERADMLVMTATPIPRTLLLAHYGDLDASRLDEKPPGRIPIATRALPVERMAEVYEAVRRAIGAGARVYWVCPLVEETEASDLAAATQRHTELHARFGGRVGLVHGRLSGKERDSTMTAFADGTLDLLVATTVIEVGVDVPEATVMVVEHAERFGLAQLHQLRGRIGRGERPSTCLLLYTAPLGETARARIAILRETEDGFRIAEEDLRLRGGGDLLGVRQSGLPAFRLADLASQAELLPMARDDAKLILHRDPTLSQPRGEALRILLYLFERDDGIRILRNG